MEYIGSKNIFMLTRDMLKLINRKVMDHGSRVAYILSMMLHETNKYEEYEIAEFCYLASFHDIGAYKTDDLGKPLQFETRDPYPHSIYGYLFFRYLSGFGERSKILLYHHTSYSNLKEINFAYKDIANYLSLADAVDVYLTALREKFNINLFQKWVGKRISAETMELLKRAEEKNEMIDALRSGRYKEVLDAQMEYLIFTNEEKKKCLELLMYCGSFHNMEFIVNTAACICICDEIALLMHRQASEREILYYAALLHDIGLLAIPKELLEADRKLTPVEQEAVKRHIPIEERIFQLRNLDEKILDVAIAHHERKDGSGYPNHLKAKDQNKLQYILQVADSITFMLAERAYKTSEEKEQIIAELQEESGKGKLDEGIVEIVIRNYDHIMSKTLAESKDILTMHTKLNTQFKKISLQFSQPAQG